MANDIDMWSEIEYLERVGEKERAKALHNIYTLKFIESNPKKAEELRMEYEKKYKDNLREYG
jgi:acetyl-CoA carboxylase beta subunit